MTRQLLQEDGDALFFPARCVVCQEKLVAMIDNATSQIFAYICSNSECAVLGILTRAYTLEEKTK